jgi:shikimate dehydrogenase
LYRAAFAELAIDGDYQAIECSANTVGETFAQLQQQNIRALSITMPLKEVIIPLLDEIDSNATLLNAVNCVSFRNGVAVGHNTDGDGCCDALEEQGSAHLRGTTAVVLGSGGTARSVALALGRRGAHVVVVNRTIENANALCQRLSSDISTHGGDVRVGTFDDVRVASVLVNTTSVGMNSDQSPLPAEYLHPNLVVLDAVYQPMVTALLRDAAQVGATTVDGLWMLIQQARRQCVHQFGEKPSVAILREAAERELSRRHK